MACLCAFFEVTTIDNVCVVAKADRESEEGKLYERNYEQ